MKSALIQYPCCLLLLWLTASCSRAVSNESAAVVDERLQSVPCWFGDSADLPPHRCFNMRVSEVPDDPGSRQITFPVVQIKSPEPATANPVLHLGGGGPGAALLLDSAYVVETIYVELKSLSVDQGRDLYLMDPRGSGRSQPLLVCREFVDNVLPGWRKNQSLEQSYREGHDQIRQCVERFTAENIDVKSYNSASIAADIEQLRIALGVEKWVLIGVSYATIYAQMLASNYADSVEAMILDSATFVDIDPHTVYLQETLAPYDFLFHYCDHVKACSQPIKNIPDRFWAIKEQLDKQPLSVAVAVPGEKHDVTIVLNGWRFVDSVLWGAYDEQIYTDLPLIIVELESRKTDAIRLYIEDLLTFLLDESYGDLSSESHYCAETKPYQNNARLRALAEQLPGDYIKEVARLGLEFDGFCEELGIAIPPGLTASPVMTHIPALFVHGELDTTTLLDHVIARRDNFANSSLVTLPQAHSVMDDPCVREAAAKFISETGKRSFTLKCE